MKHKLNCIEEIRIALRIIFLTVIICSFIYPIIILIIGQSITPWTANGWLVYNNKGQIIGSRIIAQAFTRPEYFHPRPSAVDYNAAAAGGSNLSPANPELRKRVEELLSRYPQASEKNPIPFDLVTASGSGLDPHITLKAAKFQLARVSSFSGISQQVLQILLEKLSVKKLKIIEDEPIINVLQVNLEIDRIMKTKKIDRREKTSGQN